MKVCVVGAGNAGSAYACKTSLEGHEVTLLKTSDAIHEEHFKATRSRGGMTMRDVDGSEVFVPLRKMTRDPQEAFAENFDAILILTQTTRHNAVAAALRSTNARAKALLVAPGYLGSTIFRRALGDRCAIYAEGESLAYDARIEEPGVVRICFKNYRNALGFIDPESIDEGLALAAGLVDTYQYARANVVDSALRNPNLILHTLGCLVSASRIEYSGGDFWMYREAFTPSVWRLVDALDAEKMRVQEAFGGLPTPYLRDCAFRSDPDPNVEPMESFLRYARDGGPKGPSALDTRYLTEDVPCGLGLLVSLGASVGIPTPVADAAITLAGALLGRDLHANIRSLECLGFDSAASLRRFCNIHNA